MNLLLTEIKQKIYDKLNFEISNYKDELESKEYNACRFQLNKFQIISRTAKITPKKTGQFVTFWKRLNHGEIAPLDNTDHFVFFIINVSSNNRIGQFVFPKSILIEKAIISTNTKEGKRGFRVYPSWDFPLSKQAQKSQKWQLNYFFEINSVNKLDNIEGLYKI
ncbi:MepB family protein [Aurantibacter sp.]|uniref:MepB family protein n=1 Tax=Aurantibacter sp. TaxID=2807103 RepID=UPI0035C7A5AD